MRSHVAAVLRRWATNTAVRPSMREVMAPSTCPSVPLSNAEVTSSSSSSRGSFKKARAMATRCFSPPDSFSPRSPTTVSYPSGIARTASCIAAARAAPCNPSSSAAKSPYAMLFPMVSLKSTGSWGTTPIACLREATS
mmetsp:Transcript_36133/g.101812  ORF Transcript_36133/g.101812 Transcript_36133/m.101812 type:complete len:138 (-) Transcript_36133:382-795(-)